MRIRSIASFGVPLMFSGLAFGQNWINPAGGSWQDAANWEGDAVPADPTFDLGSTSGYTVTLSNSTFANTLAVQNDNVTIGLNGYDLQPAALDVATVAGQNGSLTVLGPGVIDSFATPPTAGAVSVGALGESNGQLVLNDVQLLQEGYGFGGFQVSNLVAENGTAISIDTNGIFCSIGNATIDDSSIVASPTGEDILGIGQVSMMNGSTVESYTVSIGGGTVDDSSIGSYTTLVGGNLTISDGGSVSGGTLELNGNVTVLPTGNFDSGRMTMESGGSITIQLNAQVESENYVITQPYSDDSGTLVISLQTGFEPAVGDQFPIMDTSPELGNLGTFATLDLPPLPAGEQWDTSQLYTTGVLSVVVPEPAGLGIFVFGLIAIGRRRPGR
jgi:hypothetical protein